MKFFKLFASLFTMCSFTANAQYSINDFVIEPGSTRTISISLNTQELDMEGSGASIYIKPAEGYTYSNASIAPGFFTYAQLNNVVITDYGELRFQLGNMTGVKTGSNIDFATFDVTASNEAKNITLEVFSQSIRTKDKQRHTFEDFSVTTNVLRDLTISEVGYSTFSACAPVVIEGGTICTGTLNSDKTMLSIAEETGSVVPANTGVIIKGEAGTTVTLAPATEAGSVGDNDLVSSKEAKKKDNVLALTVNEGAPVFWRWDSEYEIPDNKAFLPWTGNNAPVRIDFGGNSIESVNAERNIGHNYNLMGLQVKAQKGIVIENGKKVINL